MFLYEGCGELFDVFAFADYKLLFMVFSKVYIDDDVLLCALRDCFHWSWLWFKLKSWRFRIKQR